MGLHLLAAITLADLGVYLLVALGLGMVIFVHELGHFAVAKMCGVKCEKFFLGFDIYGLKISRKWGETEYGIGILPLGGYVKMLGQEDNPAAAAEELRRAQLSADGVTPDEQQGDAQPPATTGSLRGLTADGRPIYDPRSYMAKSVPQRMAIISAGVIMNVLFAFVISVIAYTIGVPYTPPIAGESVLGSPAWQAGMLPGDRIVSIDGYRIERFRDIQQNVTLGNLSDGLLIGIQRPGSSEIEQLRMDPDRGPLPQIGVRSMNTLTVARPDLSTEASPYTGPQLQSDPELKSGDVIVAVRGERVTDYLELRPHLFQDPSQPLVLTVERTTKEPAGEMETETLDVTLQPRPVQELGLIMGLGPVTSVQTGGPAARAGIQPGDQILEIDGKPIEDPVRLAAQLRTLAGREVNVLVQRGTEELSFDDVVLAPTGETMLPPMVLRGGTVLFQPLVVPALGLSYALTDTVVAVQPGSAAAEAGVNPGEEGLVIKQARVLPPAGAEPKAAYLELEIPFGETEQQSMLPVLVSILQEYPVGTKVELTFGNDQTVTLTPQASTDWFVANYGLQLQPLEDVLKVTSLGQALRLGLDETINDVLQVYYFLQKLGTNFSPLMISGPVGIVNVAAMTARSGFPKYLLFLALLSANLAVINFLPIPVLDGGHMVFLLIEGVRGKPVSENIVIGFHYVGFLFIVGLMLFVIGLDTGLISRF